MALTAGMIAAARETYVDETSLGYDVRRINASTHRVRLGVQGRVVHAENVTGLAGDNPFAADFTLWCAEVAANGVVRPTRQKNRLQRIESRLAALRAQIDDPATPERKIPRLRRIRKDLRNERARIRAPRGPGRPPLVDPPKKPKA